MSLTPSTMLPLGTAAPDFKLPDTSGKIVSPADFKDKAALLVIFMCNHCPYVVHIRAGLAQLARDYAPRRVAIVGINSNDAANYPDDSPAELKKFAEAEGLSGVAPLPSNAEAYPRMRARIGTPRASA